MTTDKSITCPKHETGGGPCYCGKQPNGSDPFAVLDELLDDNLSDIEAEEAAMEVDFLDTPAELGTPISLPEGEIDPRLKLISHSSRTTLHKCPRKYQLYRLSSQQAPLELSKQVGQDVTFAYGKAVGIGIQSVMENKTETQIYLDVFLEWDTDLLVENPKQKKSIWEALFAVQRFIHLRSTGYLEDYELVYYNGQPAVELSFRIHMPDDFKYRGYVDGVLRHKVTGAIIVLEAKTTSGTPNSTTYKNSGQAIGYSVVLDILFPEASSYEVLYLVYATKQREYTTFYFEKSLLQRALWLQELLIDCKHVQMYEDFEVYPMHGENCLDFFRDCEYLGLCTLSTENLTKPLTQELLDKIADEVYMFDVDFYDLVESQLEKGEG